MTDYTQQLKKHLREAGCRFERQGRGDHEIWYSPNTGTRFVVLNTSNPGTQQMQF